MMMSKFCDSLTSFLNAASEKNTVAAQTISNIFNDHTQQWDKQNANYTKKSRIPRTPDSGK